MTVNTANITSGPYAGNDIVDTFDYDFRIEDKSQLIVYETDDTGAQTALTVDTDYSVSGIGVDAGGQVTRVAGALPTGYTWYIRSNYQATQATAFASQGGFFPDVHELAFDKLTFLIQQLSDGKDRTFKLADSLDVDGDFALLADAAERAGMYLTFDSNGDITVTTSPQVLTVDGIYDTVALMRAASLDTGLMIMTRGYTTAGDGDWAVYYIKPPQTFDNIIDHELANGNVAVLQRLSANMVSNTAAGIVTSTIQQNVNDELAGFIQTLQNYTAQDWYANTSTYNITVDSDYNLTSAQNLSARIVITDTSVILTTGRNIVVADTARLFIAKNDTAQTLTFKTAAGSGIAVAAGKTLILMCDGTNVIEPEIASYGYISDIISGTTGSPRIDEKAHKQYKMCVYTSSGKHYMKANKRSLIVAVGGGGSGAGRDSDGAASCSGGGSGSLVWKDTTPTSDETLTLTVGAGGASVTTINNNGNDGSDTTVVGTTVNMTAGAGKGGVQSSTLTTTASAAPNASSGYDGIIAGGRSGAVTGGAGNLATGGGSLNYDSSTITGGTDVGGAGGNPQSTVTLTANETDVEQYYIGEIDSTFSSMFLALIGNVTFADNKGPAGVGGVEELFLNEILTTGMTLPSPTGNTLPASGLGAGGGAFASGVTNGEGSDGSFGGGGGAACYASTTTGQGGRGGNGVVIVMQEI